MSSSELLVENICWGHTQQYSLYHRKKDECGVGLSPVVLLKLSAELLVEAMSRYKRPNSCFPDYLNHDINSNQAADLFR